MIKIKFSEVGDEIKESPGIYEIHTHSGIPLKVGVAENLKKRLSSQHGPSRQSGLKPKNGSKLSNSSDPSEVESKASILAKHLFFDKSITEQYDLRTEEGRRSFLENECYIRYEYRPNGRKSQKLKDEEKKREKSGKFRYVGKVIRR